MLFSLIMGGWFWYFVFHVHTLLFCFIVLLWVHLSNVPTDILNTLKVAFVLL